MQQVFKETRGKTLIQWFFLALKMPNLDDEVDSRKNRLTKRVRILSQNHLDEFFVDTNIPDLILEPNNVSWWPVAIYWYCKPGARHSNQ